MSEQQFLDYKRTLPLPDKWFHYFDIYNKHISKFKTKHPVILEIGVQHGGSIEMWNRYFNGNCTIYGIDIDENALNKLRKSKSFDNNVILIHGDQGNEIFWTWFKRFTPMFDIIIDDGGHFMNQQKITFDSLFYDKLVEGGVYICEDTHTSYFSEYGGGLQNENSFVEFSKQFIDYLHIYFMRQCDIDSHNIDNDIAKKFKHTCSGMHFYDSMIVFDKNTNTQRPFTIKNMNT
jgi:cephalosporin hydroxylase